jgi:hypothetical protein
MNLQWPRLPDNFEAGVRYWTTLKQRITAYSLQAKDFEMKLLGQGGSHAAWVIDASRAGVERIKASGSIFMAWSYRPWILGGAAVPANKAGNKEELVTGVPIE